uniref:Uncharacterized protein n=1 Tax=viral metagenome TaxID=1070528 RepID=A0A6M3LMI8_9ZZZZ
MRVTVRIPKGDKCYEDTPRYLCPFFKQVLFDGAADGDCSYLNKRWPLAGMVAHSNDYQKHPKCPSKVRK